MSRKKLKELTLKELEKLYHDNREFACQIWSDIEEDNMYWQGEEYEQIFGKNNRTIRQHDNYNSFYLTITDHDNFAESLCDMDCFNTETASLWLKAKNLASRWQNMDYDEQDRHPELYEAMERTNNELLEIIEKALHEYENITDDEIAQKLQDILDGISYMEDWEMDENGLVYQHIEKVYK